MWAEFAPAKVNLTLEITGRRHDGYHEMESVVVFADYGDRLTAEPSHATALSITGPFAAALQGQEADNLILKAVRAAEAVCGASVNLNITLEKNLPVASGIGGGSADAAAMLRILRKVLAERLTPERCRQIALSLGADVPVCLESRSAHMSGIGERVAPLDSIPPLSILLVNPLKALPTKDVFQAWHGEFVAPVFTPEALRREGALNYIAGHSNMLEDAAISKMPQIAGLLASINATRGCILSRMSGSGATCFGLYETAAEAENAAAAVSKVFPSYWASPAQLLTQRK